MNEEKIKEVAAHMVEQYKDSSYTARQRASDHACSYESNSPQFKYWVSVGAEILKLQKRIAQ